MTDNFTNVDAESIFEEIDEAERRAAALGPRLTAIAYHPYQAPVPSDPSTDTERAEETPIGLLARQFLLRLHELRVLLETHAPQVDRLPPVPETLRGRVGVLFLKLVARLTWWQMRQLTDYANAVQTAFSENAAMIHALLQAQIVNEHHLGRLRAEMAQLCNLGVCHQGRNSATVISSPNASEGVEAVDFDKLYLGFQDVFRGPREAIKERLRNYVPFLRNSSLISEMAPVVDIGCGRGEWLELLRENDFPCLGLESNSAMAGLCEKLGLPVIQRDGIDYLTTLPAASVVAVSAFHLIEHIAFSQVLELLASAHRALKPGGLLLLETPDPYNLTVGSYSFHLDPTHLRPIPIEVLRHFTEVFGFEHVATLRLHPDLQSPPPAPNTDAWLQDLYPRIHGARDHALVVRRPETGCKTSP